MQKKFSLPLSDDHQLSCTAWIFHPQQNLYREEPPGKICQLWLSCHPHESTQLQSRGYDCEIAETDKIEIIKLFQFL